MRPFNLFFQLKTNYLRNRPLSLVNFLFNFSKSRIDWPTDLLSYRDAILHFCDVTGPSWWHTWRKTFSFAIKKKTVLRTDRQTDRPRDRPSFGDARTHLKRGVVTIIPHRWSCWGWSPCGLERRGGWCTVFPFRISTGPRRSSPRDSVHPPSRPKPKRRQKTPCRPFYCPTEVEEYHKLHPMQTHAHACKHA